MARVVRAGGAALSQSREGSAAGRSRANAADLLFAEWFNLLEPSARKGAVRLRGDAAVRGHRFQLEPVPDETTVCKFRHLLEEPQLGEPMPGKGNLHLQAKGLRITTGTIVDATLLHAPTSIENRPQQRDPEMNPDEEGQTMVLRKEGTRGGG